MGKVGLNKEDGGYCMHNRLSCQNLDEWVCESCTKDDGMLSLKHSTIMEEPLPSSANIALYDGKHLASPSKKHIGSGWQAHSSRQKAVTSGKVRFITQEEVQQLYRTKSPSPINSSVAFKSYVTQSLSRGNVPSDVTRPKCGRPAKKQNISLPEKGSPISIACTVIPPKCGRPPKMLSISKINQQAPKIREQSQEKWSPGTHTKWHNIMEQPKNASVLSQGAETSSRKTVKEQNKPSCTPSSSSRDSSLNMSSGGEISAAERKHSNGEERDLISIISSFRLYRCYLPALQATWKGGFMIHDADAPAQFIGGFQARLPCKVHHKVFDFSQKMPSVLQATLLPQLHLWDDPFHNECPALDDVALYLFPDDNTSSRETYASLFEAMHTKNSVMRIYFDGVDAVELLIYTSKQLRFDFLDTVTCPKTQNFLWGIFCAKGGCEAEIDDTATTADMEVDMVGGSIVGSVDIVVPKVSSTPSKTSPQPTMIKDMEIDMVGGNMVGSVDAIVPSVPSTPNKMSEQLLMSPVQQLLRITKEQYSNYQDKVRALDTAVKLILGVKSEELKNSDTSASSAMRTPALHQVKLEKEEDEMVGTSSTINRGHNQS